MATQDPEKVVVYHQDSGSDHARSDDKVEVEARTADFAAIVDSFTPAEKKNIVWRIDRRLVTTLGALYAVSLMDRTNLASAMIADMGKDLRLIGPRYSIITLIFFIPYVIFQPPATVLMRKIGPRNFLSTIVLLWGGVMIAFGFAKNWTVLVGLRVVLGVLEAGFFPGCAYLLSTWYPRYDLQKRNAVFYLIGSMASAFAGILAYGLMQMKGLANLNGWSWIFIMEGILTCLLGVAGYFLIVDFPEKAASSLGFLTEREANFIVARIELDRDDAYVTPFSLSGYLRNALDSKVWGFAFLFLLTTTQSYAIAYFLPIILRSGMGFSIAASQCLVAPPYVLAAIVMYLQAMYADKTHQRAPIIMANAIIGLIGLPLLGFAKNNGARYFGVFLATVCANANIPAILTYQANNIRGQWKRAFTSATLVGFGGIGGIIGSTVFRSQDSPGYTPGIITCMIANGLVLLITSALSWKFWRANKRVEAGGKMIEGLEGFKYTL